MKFIKQTLKYKESTFFINISTFKSNLQMYKIHTADCMLLPNSCLSKLLNVRIVHYYSVGRHLAHECGVPSFTLKFKMQVCNKNNKI